MTSSRIIVALDVPEADRAVALARQLAPHVAMVKIGLESFVGHGPDLVRQIRATGVDIFLDLKLHDIPRTAAAAARQAASLDVKLLTLHAAGGPDMVKAVKDATGDKTHVIAVTLLTSFDQATTEAVGFRDSTSDAAVRLGALARKAGADGLVCSAHELDALKILGGLRVVPGVRPAGTAAGDQKRVATPQAAVQAGASWSVVGRPILEAADPVAATQAINRACAS